jgi:hypothetical protein
MPLPHETFSPAFREKLKVMLNRARNAENTKEVWAVMHFDTDIKSVETYHSHGSMGAVFYRNAFESLVAANGGADKAQKQRFGALARDVADAHMAQVPNYVPTFDAMHAEEELITAFPRVLNDWTATMPAPISACIYQNWSPCNKSPAKTIGQIVYPVGCMHKVARLANTYAHAQIVFTVYYDSLFDNTQAYTTALAAAGINNLLTFSAMPAELR